MRVNLAKWFCPFKKIKRMEHVRYKLERTRYGLTKHAMRDSNSDGYFETEINRDGKVRQQSQLSGKNKTSTSHDGEVLAAR
jgi:hypothetical protein